MGLSTLCCFSIDTLLSFSHCLSLLVSLCVFILKPFVCFHFIVNSIPLNLSTPQSGPTGTLHSVSASLFYLLPGAWGIMRAEGALLPWVLMSQVSFHGRTHTHTHTHTHAHAHAHTHTHRNIHASHPMYNSHTSSYCRHIFEPISRLPLSCTMTPGVYNFPCIIPAL